MEHFEDIARGLTEGLDLSKRVKRRIAEEAQAHLEDEMQQCLAEGMGEDEAREEAQRRFGETGALNGLIAAALARQQARHRRIRSVLVALGAGALLLTVLVVGAGFQVFDDLVTGDSDLPSVPLWAKKTLYCGVFVAFLFLLMVAAAKLFRRRVVHALIAGILVWATMFASQIVFAHTPLRGTIGWISPGESATTLAAESFFMRLYLCWAPTLVLGGLCIALCRDRAAVTWLVRILAVGALSASLWGLNRLGRYGRWLHAYKWPKLAAGALLALVFVLLVALLARAIGRQRSAAPAPVESAPDAAPEPGPDPAALAS